MCQLKVFSDDIPEDKGGQTDKEHRIKSPVRVKTIPVKEPEPVSEPPKVKSEARRLPRPAEMPEEADEYRRKVVPQKLRERYGRETTIRQFWQDCQVEGRWERIGKPNRKKGTEEKEKQAVNRFEKHSRPEDHPPGEPWGGPSLAWLVEHPKYLDGVFARMSDELSTASVSATKSHLMTIINHAVGVHAVEVAPKLRTIDKEGDNTRVLTTEEADRLLRILRPHSRLLAAAVLALSCGPRPRDLFCLKWSDFQPDMKGRRIVKFEANKTGKLQGVPVLESTWWFLDRLPRDGDYVFAGLTQPESQDPERSRAARERNSLFKMLLREIGLGDLVKPWQALRKTCNERLESVAPGVGQFVLGHKLVGVNAVNYRSPTESVWAGMEKVPLDAAVAELVPCIKRQLLLF